jgi:hypothetical protein
MFKMKDGMIKKACQCVSKKKLSKIMTFMSYFVCAIGVVSSMYFQNPINFVQYAAVGFIPTLVNNIL